MTTVAIMQPTYLPWLGYFDLIDRSDVFVFLDSVQFGKRTWQQRNRIKTPSGAKWITIPVLSKGRRYQLIKDVVIDNSLKFIEKHIRLIESNYNKSPYFEAYAPAIFAILRKEHKKLAVLNIELITWLKEALLIPTPLRLSSELCHEGVKDELLANICVQLGATNYLSSPGSRAYLNGSNSFKKYRIPILYNEYNHPVYHQRLGEFLPYMSVIDLLFNEGPRATTIIRKGRNLCA